jgi:hypothetical protein
MGAVHPALKILATSRKTNKIKSNQQPTPEVTRAKEIQ